MVKHCVYVPADDLVLFFALMFQVAKEFAAGVFVGEVVDVRRVGAKGTLWKVE